MQTQQWQFKCKHSSGSFNATAQCHSNNPELKLNSFDVFINPSSSEQTFDVLLNGQRCRGTTIPAQQTLFLQLLF